MNLKIDPRIFQQYPHVMVGVLVAHDIDNTQLHQQHIVNLLNKEINHTKSRFNVDQLARVAYITSWQDAYKKFGSNPKKYPPSIENLLRRILKGQELSSINPLVDLYNTISLKYLIPAGGEDLDTLHGDIVLTFADNNEKPVLLLGAKIAEAPAVGEVIYKDEQGAFCRKWNWREADRTKLTAKTRNALLVLEALPPFTKAMLESALYELAENIKKYCGGTVTGTILDIHYNALVLKEGNIYRKSNTFTQVKEVLPFIDSDSSANLNNESSLELTEHAMRLRKVQEMRQAGIEPWPAPMPVEHTCHDVLAQYQSEQEATYTVAGRLITLREHGKTIFAHMQDRSGRLQIYLRQDGVGEEKFSFFKHMIDSGDIVWFQGSSFTTKTGEITLKVDDFKLLSKCLYPLPEKFHGLTDVEIRYRQRYLDLMSSPESAEKFKKRIKLLQAMRNYLNDHDFLEVETPMLHPIPGGAAARPFVTHHNAYDMDLYLRIAPELYLKRLVIGSFERVYEINRNFRNEGISTRHNPEFTMLEFYMAYQDYHFIMDFVERMLNKVALEVAHTHQLLFGEHSIDFEKPFDRLSPRQAVIKYGKVPVFELTESTIDATMRKYNVVLDAQASFGRKMYALFEALAEPHIVQPTFIIDFPIEVSPLAKRDPDNPYVAARFELFIAGMEFANGFNELNDPFDQAERFKEQAKAHAGGDPEAMHYDADYVHALEYGLPPTVGVGIGIDRLTMLLTNTTSIKDVILFPTLKRKAE
jgi:lysyl-tRNA synthetase class 2